MTAYNRKGLIRSGKKVVPSEQESADLPAAVFGVGQAVRIDTEYYRQKSKHGNERYQRITEVWAWVDATPGVPKFGYTFLNGDRCNEIFVRGLTKKERGE